VERNRDTEVISDLKAVGFNNECQVSTYSFADSSLRVELDNSAGGYCEYTPGSGVWQGESMIVFTPRQSGWFYASAYSGTKSKNSVIELKTADHNQQITSTTLNKTPAFDEELELRLGQSIPVNVPNVDQTSDPYDPLHPHPTLIYREGVFEGDPVPNPNPWGPFREETHFWRFQAVPTVRWDGGTGNAVTAEEVHPTVKAGSPSITGDDMRYTIVVDWWKHPQLELGVDLFMAPPLDGTVAPVQIAANLIDEGAEPIGPIGQGRVQRKWSISHSDLEQFIRDKGSRKNKFDAPRAPRRNSVKKRGGRIH